MAKEKLQKMVLAQKMALALYGEEFRHDLYEKLVKPIGNLMTVQSTRNLTREESKELETLRNKFTQTYSKFQQIEVLVIDIFDPKSPSNNEFLTALRYTSEAFGVYNFLIKRYAIMEQRDDWELDPQSLSNHAMNGSEPASPRFYRDERFELDFGEQDSALPQLSTSSSFLDLSSVSRIDY